MVAKRHNPRNVERDGVTQPGSGSLENSRLSVPQKPARDPEDVIWPTIQRYMADRRKALKSNPTR